MHTEDKGIIDYFLVNNYLSLRLENGKTIIYINEQEFIQCKYLLVDIPLHNKVNEEMIDSVRSLNSKIKIFN